MCGRFTLTVEISDLQQEFSLTEVPEGWKPRYNISPSQPVAVITDLQQPKIEWFHWGLVPFWAKDSSIGYRLINARSETVSQKPAFRQSFANRRCMILANGFYEWQHSADGKSKSQPYYFRLSDKRPFAFAGLWDEWHTEQDDAIRSCTIITCPANKLIASIHDRMPVILSRGSNCHWLEHISQKELQDMLCPYSAKDMVSYPVSRLVNSAKVDSAECLQPLE